MYQNVVQQNATCCLLWWVFEYMALGSTFMHVAATHGFLLHLIKVTCWEEPNHDSKQRIRSTVKTSQVSSMSGFSWRKRRVKSISFPALVGLWVQRCPYTILPYYHHTGSHRIIHLSKMAATCPAARPPWNAELRCDRAEIPKAKEMMRKHAAILIPAILYPSGPIPTKKKKRGFSWLICGDVTHFAIYTQSWYGFWMLLN